MLAALERETHRCKRVHRDAHRGAAGDCQILRQASQSLDEVARDEMYQRCIAAQLPAHLRRRTGIFLDRRKPFSGYRPMVRRRFENFVGRRSETREDRPERLANLLPQTMPFKVRGIQYCEAQLVSFADDVDDANAHRSLVELDRYLGDFDVERTARRGPVLRHEWQTEIGHVFRGALRRWVSREPQVGAVQAKEFLLRVSVDGDRTGIDRQNAAGLDLLGPHG